MNKINRFVGEYAFLSNFYESPVFFDKHKFKTVEHAYQAMKATNEEDLNKIKNAKTAGEAKKFGRNVSPIRHDWDNAKVDIMRSLLESKFENPFLADLLISTGESELIEENNWNDKFWGVCRGVGKNMLGILLMEIREKLKEERKIQKQYFETNE